MSGQEERPRFLADVMLGRLARWLRVLGYDTLYSSDAEDAALARRAQVEDRILLTRDRELARRRGIRVVLLSDDRVAEQLRQVLQELGLRSQTAFSRCIECNIVLADLDRGAAQARVPPYVFNTHDRFRQCPRCGRTYWRGTHWAHMVETLESADWQPGDGE